MLKSLYKKYGVAALLVVCVVFPWAITNSYALTIACNVMIYSVIALSINLIVGFSGQLDFGRAAFVGLGGYCSAILMTTLGVPFIIAFICGGLFSAAFGALLGMLCRYSSFDYLTLITIGFSEICRKIFQNWYPVTNGSFGFATSRPTIFGYAFITPRSIFYFCLAVLAICYIAIRRITKSRMGRAYMALRDDPIAAAYAGIDVKAYKLNNFIIASFFTGIGGAMLAHMTTFISPSLYTIDESLIELQMAILGGLGSLPGSILGSLILIVVPEISRGVYQYRLLIMGVMMVILMLFAPNGLLGRGGVRDKIMDAIRRKSSIKTQK